MAKYKGKKHKAVWLKSGLFKCNGKKYSSPSGAGKLVTGLETNGWIFWKIQNHQNQWVELGDLRKKIFKKAG